MYAQSDKFTKDAVTKRMVTEFEKLEYDESSVDDERITTITFQRKLDIVREVSEWLRTIPLETTFNAPTNYNRAVLVTEMAEDIFDVLESFSTDELNDLINLWMPELPVLQTHTEQLDTMRTSLIFRLENLKRSARTRHAIVPEVADGKSDVELFQDFVDPYVIVKQALGDDVATQAAMIHQLAHALKDVRDFQLARRLMKVSERNQSVRRFSMELEFIKHISEWLKHIPTKEIVNEAERKERMTLISNLAEYLGKAKDSNLDHPIPEAEITKHVSIFLDKVLVPTVGKDNYVSYISDLKGRVKWHENPATEPQGFPSQSGVPQQDRSAELRKHYIGNDTDYGTFSENVPKSSSQEEMALPLPEEVQLYGSSSKSQSLGSQNSGRNQTLVGQPSGQDPSAPRDENNASNAQRYHPPSFPRDIQQPEHNLSSQNYRPYQSVPIATPKGIHQQEHHNYSERPMPSGYPSYRPPSVRMSPNQFNAPNDSIVPSADFDLYTQNDRQRTNVSEGSARPRTDYGQTPPCTSPCADLYSASNAPRRNDSHISHGPRSIAGSSIGPHTTSLFEDQQKNCVDLLYDVIEEWCQGLPLEEATRQDEIRNSDLKAQMELRLVLQISEINRDDNIFNNPNTYDERLDYIITELLNAVPPNPTLETRKPALKDDLKQSILTLRPEIQKARDRYRFKEQLRMTVERATQRTFELSSEMRAQMDVICEEIIDDFIEYTYANNKARLKSKAMQTIEKALSHTNSPHEHAKRLFAALSQINAPIYESIYCEIGEIRMKREIAIWLKRIPQIDSNHVQTTIRQKIKSALAKKLYGLESTQTTENNMRPAIYKALKKMGVEQDNDQLVEELLVRLRNSKTQRYQQDPIIVDEVPSYASSFDRNLPQSDPPIIEPRVQSPQNQHQRAASALGLELLQNTLNPGIPLATIPQSSGIHSTLNPRMPLAPIPQSSGLHSTLNPGIPLAPIPQSSGLHSTLNPGIPLAPIPQSSGLHRTQNPGIPLAPIPQSSGLHSTLNPGMPIAPIAQSARKTWQRQTPAIAPGVALEPTGCGGICQTSQAISARTPAVPIIQTMPIPAPISAPIYRENPTNPANMPPAISAPIFRENPRSPANIPPPSITVTSPSLPPQLRTQSRSRQLPRLDVPPDRLATNPENINVDHEYLVQDSFGFSTPNDRGIPARQVDAPRKPPAKYDRPTKRTKLNKDTEKVKHPCRCPKDDDRRPMPCDYHMPGLYMPPPMPPPMPPYGIYYYY
ncbi:hypothetical protein JYU34_000921 [Plutella xylostella]|uniref:Uncharacterized protein n=1 Tax=Plutella xylostella TaxID=51655 RepID=A0ABQ7R5M0_PLUXY|nr:hypothetical protein JYU34_000921 [Plutella xylostella]